MVCTPLYDSSKNGLRKLFFQLPKRIPAARAELQSFLSLTEYASFVL
jgi:hypothetical protein